MRYRGTGRYCGIKFYIPDTQEVTGGKRLVEHNYPFKDEHGIDNLGKKISRYQVTGIILGDDYMQQFRSLQTKLDNQEKGTLVHPGFPRGQYYCEEYSAKFSGEEQRIVYLELTLVPVGEEISPFVGENTLASMLDGINNTIESFIDDIEALWKPFDDALDMLDSVNNIIDTLDYGVSILMGNGRVHEAVDQIKGIRRNASRLVKQPKRLIKSIGESFRTIRKISTPTEQYSIYSAVAHRLNNETIVKTPTTIINGNDFVIPITGMVDLTRSDNAYFNALLLTKLTYGYALIYQIGALSHFLEDFYIRERNNKQKAPTFKPRENPIIKVDADIEDVAMPNLESPIKTNRELFELMNDIADYLEQFSFDLSRLDASFIPVQDLRLLFIRDVKKRINTTERTFNYQPNSTLPSLVLLQRAKRSALENSTFIERNGIRHPLFCLGGKNYEVLSDEE